MQEQIRKKRGVDIERIEESFVPLGSKKAAVSRRGMVATAFPQATEAGIEMLKKGGNAVDAACAASLSLAVCEPQASGVGGQTIALIHIDGETIAIDGSSRAPSLAHSSAFASREQQFIGYGATTVPSTVATIGYLGEHYGRLDWQTVIGPAIRTAKSGYRITELQHMSQANNLDKFMAVKSRSGARYFLKDGCVPYGAGDLFVQEDLGEMLERLGSSGYESFYNGEIADQIDQDMRANGGYLRRQDLELIPTPVERRPISRRYRGMQISTIPPPGAGDIMLLVLMMLNNIPKRILRHKGPRTYHYISETLRKALLYRMQNPFDPSTYHQIKDMTHLSRSSARQIASSIRDDIDRSLPLRELTLDLEDTTHLSVMDGEGNAVSMTQSIELVYGSKAAAGGLGFLYNNYMSAFDLKDPGNTFFLRPNSIPWSSVCPSIVFYNHAPWIVVGSPGSSRIFSTVSLFLSRLFDEENSMYAAMERGRIHCSMGGKISMEDDDQAPELAAHLRAKGYKVDILERYSFYLGAIHAVLKRQTGEGFQGVAEVRRDGTAGGPE